MRIVGGRWRGRQLRTPEGTGTRPTTDRMRESMASAIMSEVGLDLGGTSVLDAFAGSGAIGFELLSRGAEHVTFLERDGRACSCVKDNARALGAEAGSVAVLRGDSFRIAERTTLAGSPFGLLFLDPPYKVGADQVARLVEALWSRGHLAPSCLVVYERSAEADRMASGLLVDVRTKGHGVGAFDLMRLDATGQTKLGG